MIRRHLTNQLDLSKTAVIVNEFGDIGIDGQIIKGQNIDIVELNSGCLCCNLKVPMLDAIEEIETSHAIETLLIESSGLAEPIDTLEALTDPKIVTNIEVGPIITIISLPHFEKLSDYLGDFYTDQIRNADVLLLNKADLVTAAQCEDTRTAVRNLNSSADLIITEQCDLNLDEILRVGQRSNDDFVAHVTGLKRSSSEDHEHTHVHMDSLIVTNSNMILEEALEQWLDAIPTTIFRIKGFLNLGGAYSLFQYSMGQYEIESIEQIESLQMVFIGKDLDRDALTREYQELGSK